MKRPLVILAAVTALVSVALPAVATAHTVRHDSTITIQKRNNGNDPDSLKGRVSSDRPRCERNRTIQVFQEVPGADTLIGSTNTDGEGTWELLFAGDAPDGTYYAVATRKVLHRSTNHRHTCRRAVSDTVTFH
jgi:hypothetical protein